MKAGKDWCGEDTGVMYVVVWVGYVCVPCKALGDGALSWNVSIRKYRHCVRRGHEIMV